MRIKNIVPTKWYDIPGYDGKYQINYYGQIRRALKNGRYKELHPYIKSSNRRQAVKLNCKERDVIALIRDTFIGEVPEGYVLYHKNGLLTDNALNNIGMVTREECGKRTGKWNESATPVVKLNSDGEIVEFYRSAREAGRKNYMSYQTIMDRINGKTKGLYAGDGYIYAKDSDSEIQKVLRRIELDNKEECGIGLTKAPDVIFDF
jgi:hypothetical protein